MAGEWRYLASRLNGNGTETLIHTELPLSGVSITDTLSGPQGFGASITPEIAGLVGPDGEPVFEPWSTAIYSEKDGAIRSGGILTAMAAKGDKLALECTGFAGYPKDMPYLGDYKGVGVDPLDVFRLIWSHLQGQPRGNLGVQIDSLKSGVKIGKPLKKVQFETKAGEDVAFDAGPVMLAWYKTHDLLQEIEALVRETPFDYRELHYWSGETIKHRIELGYPRIGRRRGDLRFVVGENSFVVPEAVWDGEEYASGVLLLGTGEGAKMVKAEVNRPSEKRLRRVSTVADKAADSTKKASSLATQELSHKYARPGFKEIRVLDHPHAPLGSFGVGDEIFVQSPDGWQGDLAMWVRIIAITISPEDESIASLDVVRVDGG